MMSTSQNLTLTESDIFIQSIVIVNAMNIVILRDQISTDLTLLQIDREIINEIAGYLHINPIIIRDLNTAMSAAMDVQIYENLARNMAEDLNSTMYGARGLNANRLRTVSSLINIFRMMDRHINLGSHAINERMLLIIFSGFIAYCTLLAQIKKSDPRFLSLQPLLNSSITSSNNMITIFGNFLNSRILNKTIQNSLIYIAQVNAMDFLVEFSCQHAQYRENREFCEKIDLERIPIREVNNYFSSVRAPQHFSTARLNIKLEMAFDYLLIRPFTDMKIYVADLLKILYGGVPHPRSNSFCLIM